MGVLVVILPRNKFVGFFFGGSKHFVSSFLKDCKSFIYVVVWGVRLWRCFLNRLRVCFLRKSFISR